MTGLLLSAEKQWDGCKQRESAEACGASAAATAAGRAGAAGGDGLDVDGDGEGQYLCILVADVLRLERRIAVCIVVTCQRI